mmetsp:Transcript_25485/g.79808  ORF Transcript_25485/g.79808 Transcript_25485/m.79808 type:complete len:497 (+) Transcript_25485:2376-3866(+)
MLRAVAGLLRREDAALGPEEVQPRVHGPRFEHEERRRGNGHGPLLRGVHPEGRTHGVPQLTGPRGLRRRLRRAARRGARGQAQEPHRRAPLDGADGAGARLLGGQRARAHEDRPVVPEQAQDHLQHEGGHEGARDAREARRAGDPRAQGRRLLGQAGRELHGLDGAARAPQAHGPGHPAAREAGGHARRGVPRRDELPLHDVLGLRGRCAARGGAQERHGARLRRLLHRQLRGVRLVRCELRARAAEARFLSHRRELQPRDGVHGLRRVRPALLRGAQLRARARHLREPGRLRRRRLRGRADPQQPRGAAGERGREHPRHVAQGHQPRRGPESLQRHARLHRRGPAALGEPGHQGERRDLGRGEGLPRARAPLLRAQRRRHEGCAHAGTALQVPGQRRRRVRRQARRRLQVHPRRQGDRVRRRREQRQDPELRHLGARGERRRALGRRHARAPGAAPLRPDHPPGQAHRGEDRPGAQHHGALQHPAPRQGQLRQGH